MTEGNVANAWDRFVANAGEALISGATVEETTLVKQVQVLEPVQNQSMTCESDHELTLRSKDRFAEYAFYDLPGWSIGNDGKNGNWVPALDIVAYCKEGRQTKHTGCADNDQEKMVEEHMSRSV